MRVSVIGMSHAEGLTSMGLAPPTLLFLTAARIHLFKRHDSTTTQARMSNAQCGNTRYHPNSSCSKESIGWTHQTMSMEGAPASSEARSLSRWKRCVGRWQHAPTIISHNSSHLVLLVVLKLDLYTNRWCRPFEKCVPVLISLETSRME